MLVGLRPADSDVMRTQTYELSYWIDRMDEPWTTDEYINAGLTRTVAERWDRSGVYPPWAVDFEKAGIGPAEAWSWDVAPSLVLAYRAAGVAPTSGRFWADGEVGPEEIGVWVAAGFGFGQVQALKMAYRQREGALADRADTAVLWALTGLEPDMAVMHAQAGLSPLDFLPAMAHPRG